MLGFQALGRYALGETSVVVPIVLAETGAFSLTGNPVHFHLTRKAGTGAFTLTGQPTLRQITFRPAAGSFVLTGVSAGLRRGYRLVASPTVQTYGSHFLFAPLGRFALGGAVTGADQATTFIFTGNNANMNRAAHLDAGTGVFTWTGIDATIIVQGYPTKIRAFPRVAFGMRAGSRGGGPVGRPSIGTSVRARAFGG